MPISKASMKLYPGGGTHSKEWKALRKRVLKRAGNRCEGIPQYPKCRARNGKPHPETGAIVVLTVGHVKHDPGKNRITDLRAWCQRCHNTWDAKYRASKRKRTMARRKAATLAKVMGGAQMSLPL